MKAIDIFQKSIEKWLKRLDDDSFESQRKCEYDRIMDIEKNRCILLSILNYHIPEAIQEASE